MSLGYYNILINLIKLYFFMYQQLHVFSLFIFSFFSQAALHRCVSKIFTKVCLEFPSSSSFCSCWVDSSTHLLYIIHGPISAALVVSSMWKIKMYIYALSGLGLGLGFGTLVRTSMKSLWNNLEVTSAGWRLAVFGLISDSRHLY